MDSNNVGANLVFAQIDHPFVGSDFTSDDFAAIGTILAAAGGVTIDHYNAACVKRRMAARIRELQLSAAPAYIERLRADAVEVQRLSALLSLHVSTFYRDPSTFVALRQIFQDRVPVVPSPSPHRWWSAGCAGGEEPYSLALLAAQAPEGLAGVEILATDISHEILEKGRGGHFAPAHLGNVPSEELAGCFMAERGGYRIVPTFRAMVRFVRHDLLSAAPYPHCDLIFCRYVLIYLNAADQEQVLCRFAAALPAGGILVLGRTETLRDKTGLFTPVNATERIYRRR